MIKLKVKGIAEAKGMTMTKLSHKAEEWNRPPSKKQQRAIKDFVLYTTATCEDDLSSMLSQWLA
jgi:hypothetical protein